jgi:CRISPR/Cas system-associated exonuclease Cas4 (RecB family)
MKSPAWSFSGIKTYEQCPKKYYHVKVLKDYTEPQTEATLYGTEFHTAAELYIRDGTPLPTHFGYAKDALDKLNALPGKKYCEYEMGLTENLDPCGFKDKDVWWRGIVDLAVIDEETGEARIIDYKTGKSAKYADVGQLELMALATFKHFPNVKKVKAGLLFVVCNDFVKESYDAENTSVLWEKWMMKYNALKSSYQNNVWNPRPSGLCRRHCVVLECPHNGRS